jgi:hypothetical protein
MIKKVVAIVLLVIVASLSVAGCIVVNLPNTSSPTPTPTPTPMPTGATPNQIASTETVVGNNKTFSSDAGFNITYPKTLQIASTTNASVQVRIYVYLATNNTVDAVNVATEPVDPKATSLDYETYGIGKVSDYPNYQLISTQSTTLSGKPAYTVVWQATVPVQTGAAASTVQNQSLKVMQTYAVNNNIGYVITYKAIPGDYNTYLAQAQQIMNSFALN